MGLRATAKKPGGNGNYDLPEAGNQPAVLVAIIDLGTHPNEYEGKAYDSHRVQLVWELTTQPKSDTQNLVIGREYTLSISENSNLGKLVTALTGKKFTEGEEFDITQLLGRACLVNIVHGKSKKGNDYARVEGASALPRGFKVEPPKRKPVLWEIDGNTKLPEHLDWLPYIIGEPVLEVIRRSKEWKEMLASARKDADEGDIEDGAGANEESDDDISF